MFSRWRAIAILASVLLLGGIGLMGYGIARGADDPAKGAGGHGHWGRHGGWHHRMGHEGPFHAMTMLSGLDLTVAQQHALVDVFAKHKADLQQKREQAHKTRHAVMQAAMQENPDRQALSVSFDQAATARKQLMMARLDLRQDVMGVLTADQKAKLKEFRSKHMADEEDE